MIECSILGCSSRTNGEIPADPRQRWLIDTKLLDEDGQEVSLTLCPAHAAQFFNLTEHDFAEMERAEKFIRESLRSPSLEVV